MTARPSKLHILQARFIMVWASHRPDLLMAFTRSITPAPPSVGSGQAAQSGHPRLHPSLQFVVGAAVQGAMVGGGAAA